MEKIRFYAKTEESAKKFFADENLDFYKSTAMCACGESPALRYIDLIEDKSYVIIICENCYKNAAYYEQI
jgi:hypothetical protein